MMNSGVSSLCQYCSSSSFHSILQTHTISSNSQFSSLLIANYRHNHLPTFSHNLSLSSRSQSLKPISCTKSPGSGENDSKTVLDAFFLGKALGEALTERIESTVGEFFSTVGRLQAEQQKQVQEFQEDVLGRAKKAKEKAAREALEEQGRLIPNSSIRNAVERNVATSSAMASRVGPMNPTAATRVVKPYSPSSDGDEGKNDSDSSVGPMNPAAAVRVVKPNSPASRGDEGNRDSDSISSISIDE